MAESVKVGDLAPNFALFSEKDEAVELQDYIGKKPIVLFFYPKNNTMLCTKEVCHFRDNFDEFKNIYDAELIGISSDSIDSHKEFTEANNCTAPLLSISV